METISRTITEKDGEKRKLVQIVKRDDDGRISHYEIPNYTIRKQFETFSEREFHKTLINVIKRINEENKKYIPFNQYIQISSQVAINRIIDINNKRNGELYEEIKDKSIDYVLYDFDNGEILCCIELNGPEHDENEEVKEKDRLKKKMFEEDLVEPLPLLPIPTQSNQKDFDEENLYTLIKNALKSRNIKANKQ